MTKPPVLQAIEAMETAYSLSGCKASKFRYQKAITDLQAWVNETTKYHNSIKEAVNCGAHCPDPEESPEMVLFDIQYLTILAGTAAHLMKGIKDA